MATIKKKEGVLKLQKLGYTAEEIAKIQAALGDDESEIEDIDLLTESEARTRLDGDFKKKYEASGKAAVWDFMDRNHSKYETLLSDEAKGKYTALKSTQEKNEFLLDYFQGRNNSDVSAKDATAFKAKLTELQNKIATDYVEKTKYEEIQREIEPAYRESFNSKLTKWALKDKRIADTMKDSDRFERIFVGDFEESLSKKGYKVEHRTGKILDKEGGSVIGKDNNPLDALRYMDTILEEYPDYAKKSEGGGGSATVIVEGGKDTSKLTAAQLKNLEQMGE